VTFQIAGLVIAYAGPDFTVTCRSRACISYTSSVSQELLQEYFLVTLSGL